MIHVTCRLTAKNRDQLRNITLGNRVWATFFNITGPRASVIIIIFWYSVDIFPREFKNWDIQNWVQIYQSVQSGVGKLSYTKTALKRYTSTETLWNRKAPSLSSPEDEEIFLPKLPKSWQEWFLELSLLRHNGSKTYSSIHTPTVIHANTRWFIITGTPTKSGISLLLGHTCGYNLAWLSPR